MHASTPAVSADPAVLALRWLVRFRWGAFVSELVLVLSVDAFTDIALPVQLLVLLLGYGMATNVALQLLGRQRASLPEGATAAVLAHDVALLTGLLLATGGVHNPFSTLYLVHIALAPVVLGGRWTSALVAVSIACFAALFVVSGGLEMKPGSVGVDHATQMRIHMRGMWMAFTVAAVLIGVFVIRVRRSLEEQTKALEAMRARQARIDKLGAVATLAAGATHELGTPLATIALVAKELERALVKTEGGQGPLGEDAALIRAQVERCRGILERLASEAGALRSGAMEKVTVRQLLDEATVGLEKVEVRLDEGVAAKNLFLPSRALGMALRNLVKNGLDASKATGASVTVSAAEAEGALVIEVKDRGEGMSERLLAQAAEPFFSTKAPGQGMGLGLFLARAVAEQLEGSLTLSSTEGAGTTATVRVPSWHELPSPGAAP